MTWYVCVCIEKGDRKPGEDEGDEDKYGKGRETEGGRKRKEREKSNLQEHNKKLYLRQKRTHKGICLAVCSSRILRKFIKLERFKRRQSSKLYYWGVKRERERGMSWGWI